MKALLKLYLSLTLISIYFVVTPTTSAVEIKDKNEYLLDVRGDDGDIYLNRLSIHKKLDSTNIEISGFGEAQWNIETSEWEKLLLGVGIGKYLWQFLYIGQTLQLISGQMLDYMAFKANSYSIDTTTRIALEFPLLKQLSFNISEEYSLNLEEGRNEYCETIAEAVYKLTGSCSVGIGWHHTDRIHNLDTDYATSFIILQF